MDERPLAEILNDPVWAIDDSITMIKHHVLKLVDLGALDRSVGHGIMDRLPERPELPTF